LLYPDRVRSVNKQQNLAVITLADDGIEATREVSTASKLGELVGADPDAIEVVLINVESRYGKLFSKLLHSLAGEAAREEGVIEALLPAVIPSGPAMEQLRLNAEARAEFLRDFAAIPASELAELAGVRWSNASAWPSRLQKEGKVFAVEYGRRVMYPTFQFDENWEPYSVIRDVLAALREGGLSGWSLALWWTASNGWLDGEHPVDLIAREPERLVAAAAEAGHYPF
jgi:hypothetical protein